MTKGLVLEAQRAQEAATQRAKDFPRLEALRDLHRADLTVLDHEADSVGEISGPLALEGPTLTTAHHHLSSIDPGEASGLLQRQASGDTGTTALPQPPVANPGTETLPPPRRQL